MIITFVTHFIVDYYESKIRKQMTYSTNIEPHQGKYLNYVIVGVDQMAHLTILFLTYVGLVNSGLM